MKVEEAMYQEALAGICADPRYVRNLDWGDPRPGHEEGTIRAHLEELEQNLDRLRPKLSSDQIEKLRLLIHTHDTLKGEQTPGVPITDPRSHASLGRALLADYCDDDDLLAMTQYHDEPHAIWRQFSTKGSYNAERAAKLVAAIQDWHLFSAFLIIDNCTKSKVSESTRWFLEEFAEKVPVPMMTPADMF